MPVLRELIALLSAKVDQQSFHEAESRMFRLRTAVGGAVAGFATATAFGWAEQAARMDDARRVMEANGMMLDDLRVKTRGVFSDYELVTNYNRAKKFGLADAFIEMTKIADASSTMLGEKQDYMLQRITTGLAKMSPARLDELGILISRKELYKGLAADLGVSERSLSEQLKKQEIIREALEQGRATIDEVNRVGSKGGDTYDRWGNQIQRFTLGIGALVNIGVQKLQPWLERSAVAFEKFASNPEVIEFVDEVATSMKWVVRAFVAAGSVVGDFLKILLKVPGAGYILVGLLAGKLLAGLVSMTIAMHTAIPVLGGITGMFTVAAGGAANFAAALGFVWAMLAPLLATMGLGALLGLIIVAMFEEVFAVFDPEKVGLFERYVQNWDKLRDGLSTSPNVSGWVNTLRLIGQALTYVGEAMDHIVAQKWLFDLLMDARDKQESYYLGFDVRADQAKARARRADPKSEATDEQAFDFAATRARARARIEAEARLNQYMTRIDREPGTVAAEAWADRQFDFREQPVVNAPVLAPNITINLTGNADENLVEKTVRRLREELEQMNRETHEALTPRRVTP
jgi:hypothetical protein